jgi:hypothetical protein
MVFKPHFQHYIIYQCYILTLDQHAPSQFTEILKLIQICSQKFEIEKLLIHLYIFSVLYYSLFLRHCSYSFITDQ